MPATTDSLSLLATPEHIRETAEKILNAPPYVNTNPDLRTDLIKSILDWINRALKPLVDFLSALYESSKFLYYGIVILCLLALVGLVLHIAWTLYRAMQTDKPILRAPEGPQDMQKYANDLEAQGNAARQAGDYTQTIRLYYRCSIIRIEVARGSMPRRGATNRQYLKWFRNTAVYEPLAVLVNSIDESWFGGIPITDQQMDHAQQAFQQLTSLTRSENLFGKN